MSKQFKRLCTKQLFVNYFECLPSAVTHHQLNIVRKFRVAFFVDWSQERDKQWRISLLIDWEGRRKNLCWLRQWRVRQEEVQRRKTSRNFKNSSSWHLSLTCLLFSRLTFAKWQFYLQSVNIRRAAFKLLSTVFKAHPMVNNNYDAHRIMFA